MMRYHKHCSSHHMVVQQSVLFWRKLRFKAISMDVIVGCRQCPVKSSLRVRVVYRWLLWTSGAWYGRREPRSLSCWQI